MSGTITLAEVRDDHMKWVQELAKEFNASCIQAAEPTTALVPLPCGLFTTSPHAAWAHRSRCKACRAVLPPKPRSGKVETVFKVPELPSFDMPGLLSVLKGRRDALLEASDQYDRIIKAIEGLEALEAKAKQWKEEKEQHQKAIDWFLHNKP